jgi:dTDP-4-dehydrorhamnose reductase
MRILILGANGMLGHRLFIELSKHHEVYGTVRNGTIPSFANRDQIYTYITAPLALPLIEVVKEIRPDVVINCIANIRYDPDNKYSKLITIEANSIFPIDLANCCEENNTRLIHFSTDGVFSGKRGNYTEDDTPDATDAYGMTKRLGEISDQKHVLTLRCCPIGREIGAKKSLVEWFLSQTGTVKGYTKALFTPLSTHKIASVLNDFILPNGELHGLYHLTLGDVISKYDFLCGIRGNFNHDIEIVPDGSVSINRTLNSNRLVIPLSGNFDDYIMMLETMAADNALYEGEHAHG